MRRLQHNVLKVLFGGYFLGERSIICHEYDLEKYNRILKIMAFVILFCTITVCVLRLSSRRKFVYREVLKSRDRGVRLMNSQDRRPPAPEY